MDEPLHTTVLHDVTTYITYPCHNREAGLANLC